MSLVSVYSVRQRATYDVYRSYHEDLPDGSCRAGGGVSSGAHDDARRAYEVAHALAAREVVERDLPPGDPGVVFPEPVPHVPGPELTHREALRAVLDSLGALANPSEYENVLGLNAETAALVRRAAERL